jgi:hypothetical protein
MAMTLFAFAFVLCAALAIVAAVAGSRCAGTCGFAMPIFNKLLLAAMGVALLVLAATGVPVGWRGEGALGGWSLMFHVAAGGGLLFAAAIAAVAWGRALAGVVEGVRCRTRITLWIFLAATLAAGLPAMGAMTPLFGPHDHGWLFAWHGVASVVMLWSFVVLVAWAVMAFAKR